MGDRSETKDSPEPACRTASGNRVETIRKDIIDAGGTASLFLIDNHPVADSIWRQANSCTGGDAVDFQISEEQKLLKDAVRKIAKKEFEPRAAEVDEKEEFPWGNKDILAENGLLGINCPREYGGSGASILTLALAIEEIARVCASTAHIISTQSLVVDAFVLKGTHEQKTKWLPPLAGSGVIGAFAMTEPNAGSDIISMKSRATRTDEGYVIEGSKRFITHGHSAGVILVVAYSDSALKHGGLSLFVVPGDAAGLVRGKKEKKMGLRGSDTTDLSFEACLVPKENLLGQPGDGFKTVMALLNASRLGIAAEAVGISQGALDQVVNNTRGRVQFGKPLAEFQGLQWVMADMALKVELARTLLYRACAAVEKDRNAKEVPGLSAMTKWFASDSAMEITTRAVQLFGGYGYVRDYPMERMMRDAKITQLYEGTNEILRNVVSRQLLR
jgi:alkylation response protein AidB-like acyl-CoA dehydrogenase